MSSRAKATPAFEPLKERAGSTYWRRLGKDLRRNCDLYLLFLPVLAFFALFCYVPMYGIGMAFFDYVPALGFSGSEFMGFEQFRLFFRSVFFGRVMRNTVVLNLLSIVFVFPAPIILALLLFEIKSRAVVGVTQVLTYMPFFISLVVVCGMIVDFSGVDGLFNDLLSKLGRERFNLLNDKKLYFPIYLLSDIWQGTGFASIVYYAALCSVDTQLYDAGKIDGAGRFRQLISITLPSILPIVMVMFIIRMGGILNVGFEKSYLLNNDLNAEVSEVIATFVYDRGIQKGNYGYGTAVGLFSAVINFVFLCGTNWLSRKTENSLW